MSNTHIEAVSRSHRPAGGGVPLIPQLSSSATIPTEEELRQTISSPAITLLVARTDGILSGMLALVIFRAVTGVRGIIEDVVVDERYRGKGIAEQLTLEAFARARAAGVRTIDLTSRPSRETANRLYQRLGFELRETNSYRYTL